jgi:hypothetical protein
MNVLAGDLRFVVVVTGAARVKNGTADVKGGITQRVSSIPELPIAKTTYFD